MNAAAPVRRESGRLEDRTAGDELRCRACHTSWVRRNRRAFRCPTCTNGHPHELVSTTAERSPWLPGEPPGRTFTIGAGLASKLAAIAVHVLEHVTNREYFHLLAARALAADPQVIAWIGSLGLLAPVRKHEPGERRGAAAAWRSPRRAAWGRR